MAKSQRRVVMDKFSSSGGRTYTSQIQVLIFIPSVTTHIELMNLVLV